MFDPPKDAVTSPAPVVPAVPSVASDVASNGPASPTPAPIEEAPAIGGAPNVEAPVAPVVAPAVARPETSLEDVDDLDEGDPVDEAAMPDPSDFPIRVRLGQVAGLLHRAPIGIVQDLLAECADRIEAGRNSPSIALLQERMRVTEGRCAPVVFHHGGTRDTPPFVIAGVESVSAALNLGLDHVFVLIVATEDVGAAQRHVVANAGGLPLSSKTDAYTVER